MYIIALVAPRRNEEIVRHLQPVYHRGFHIGTTLIMGINCNSCVGNCKKSIEASLKVNISSAVVIFSSIYFCNSGTLALQETPKLRLQRLLKV